MRTGIFGGSFDPPHMGHINIAIAAKKKLGLDRLILVPTGKAPHKSTISENAEDRAAMCRQICKKFGFELSRYEVEKEGNCYTADLLADFAEEYPGDEFFLVVGGDSLDYMDKWYHPERIFPMCTVAVARRRGDSEGKADFLKEKFGAKIVFLDCDYYNVSSTEVRDALKKGKSVSEWLLPETEQYIRENNLYR
ncbi:MAG: nicotinate (nicotinamide) nucleotide adenylyltransferase [Clostridia bacterium]|nr:nicotinate (nicotinamide) nucleotide adenylyltransferase [Clostridia bacterium]